MPVFYRKTGFSEYLRCKYSDSPRPSGTPLINAGGKISTFLYKLRLPHLWEPFILSKNPFAEQGLQNASPFTFLPLSGKMNQKEVDIYGIHHQFSV